MKSSLGTHLTAAQVDKIIVSVSSIRVYSGAHVVVVLPILCLCEHLKKLRQQK